MTYSIDAKKCAGRWLGRVKKGSRVVHQCYTLRDTEKAALVDASKELEKAVRKVPQKKRRKK